MGSVPPGPTWGLPWENLAKVAGETENLADMGLVDMGKKQKPVFFWVVQKMNMLALGRNLFKWMYSIIFDVLYILYIRFLFESFFEFKLL